VSVKACNEIIIADKIKSENKMFKKMKKGDFENPK